MELLDLAHWVAVPRDHWRRVLHEAVPSLLAQHLLLGKFRRDNLSRDLVLLLLLQNHIERAHVTIVLRQLSAGGLARVARVACRLLATVILEHGDGLDLCSCGSR